MERKKIVPKAKFDASKQEELLRKLQQDTEKAVKVEENKASIAPVQQKEEKAVKKENNTVPTVKIQQNTATTVKTNTFTAAPEKTAKIQRITVDMPLELYERMKDQVDDNGQTIKGFIVSLVKQHFAKK